MSKVVKIPVEEDVLNTINKFFRSILEKGKADVLLVPQDVPSGVNTVQTLAMEPANVKSANPFAFILSSNSADMLVDTTDQSSGERIVAFFRPCEMRAVFELAKLHQINLENTTLISSDCLGTLPVPEYTEVARNSRDESLTKKLMEEAKDGGVSELSGITLRSACQICEFPVFDRADVSILTIGLDDAGEITLKANTEKGEALLSALELEMTDWEEPQARRDAVEALSKVNSERREKLTREIKDRVKDTPGFLEVIAGCIKCHNCMNVCPICYCKECFFESDTLALSPKQYMNKAKKKGVIRMPIDTALYHIGRMNHMITSCVSCGQCESGCPSKLPLLAIYYALGKDVQTLFDYVAGKSLGDELPLATFKEEELSEV